MPRSLRNALLVLALGLAVAGPVAALPQAQGEHARLRDYFTEQDLARSRHYRGPAYALAFGGILASLSVLAAIAVGPGARRIGSWAARLGNGRWWVEALLLAGVVVLAPALARLPLGIARHLHDRRFGLTVQGVPRYVEDVGRAVGVQAVITAVAGLVFFALARRFPYAWPAAVAAAGIALIVLLVSVAPVVLEPIFNRFRPVAPDVRARVLEIADRAGVRVDRVLVADASRRTTTQNAYVSGIGATKRVVLYDNLLAKSSPRQVDLVVAHELGHVAHGDVQKSTALASAGAVAAVLLVWALLRSAGLRAWFGATGPGDPRALPFLAVVLTVAGLVTAPLGNWVSRHMEAAADRAAIDYTRDPDTAISVEVALARDDLADLRPKGFIRWAFFSHPTVLERIQTAVDWKSDHPAVR